MIFGLPALFPKVKFGQYRVSRFRDTLNKGHERVYFVAYVVTMPKISFQCEGRKADIWPDSTLSNSQVWSI